MTSHVLCIGGTQSGKTWLSNQLHIAWPHLSIFVNTNEVDYVYGYPIYSAGEILSAARRSRHLKLEVDRDLTFKQRVQLMGEVQDVMFRLGQGSKHRWWQLLVDEAHEFTHDSKASDLRNPIKSIATRALGAYGGRLVAITQYPTGLDPTTRTNLPDRIVFDPGAEGETFLRNAQWDHTDAVIKWTSQKHHFVRYRNKRLVATYTPVS